MLTGVGEADKHGVPQHEPRAPHLIGYPLTDDRPQVLEGVLFSAVTRSRAATVPSSATQSTCSMDTSRGPTSDRSMLPELSEPPAKAPNAHQGSSACERAEGTACCCFTAEDRQNASKSHMS